MVASAMRRALVAILIFAACAQTIGPAAWEGMTAREKTIYVQSLIGHERARERKGGNRLHYDLPPEEYVRRIDAAYRRGDRRNAGAIFEEMGTR